MADQKMTGCRGGPPTVFVHWGPDGRTERHWATRELAEHYVQEQHRLGRSMPAQWSFEPAVGPRRSDRN